MFKTPLILTALLPLAAACSTSGISPPAAPTDAIRSVHAADRSVPDQQTLQAPQSTKDTREERPMTKPKLIIFDVNETLLDLAGLRSSVGEALGGREELLPLWFSTMLHYSLVETVAGEHHSFGEIGTAALMMVASTQGIELTQEEAKEAIVTPLRSLPPHDDVVASLKALGEKGYKIVSLTNSSAKGVETQFKNAGLTDLFAKRYTVDTVRKYKPHPAPYEMVLKDQGVDAADAMMVAAHAWDILGAHQVGLQTAFIKRPGKALYPLAPKPDLVLKDLTELVDHLSK